MHKLHKVVSLVDLFGFPAAHKGSRGLVRGLVRGG